MTFQEIVRYLVDNYHMPVEEACEVATRVRAVFLEEDPRLIEAVQEEAQRFSFKGF